MFDLESGNRRFTLGICWGGMENNLILNAKGKIIFLI